MTKKISSPALISLKAGLLLSVCGAVFGLATSLANHGHLPGGAYPSAILGPALSWATAAFLACMPARGGREAFRRGILFLYPAVVAYYGNDVREGTYAQQQGQVDVLGVGTDVVAYVLVSTGTSFALGVLVWLIHRDGFIGLIAATAYPVFLSYSSAELHRQTAWFLPEEKALLTVTQWTAYGAGTLALVVFAAGLYRLTRRRRKSLPARGSEA